LFAPQIMKSMKWMTIVIRSIILK